MQHDPYSIYVRSYGKTASGAKLTDADYGITHIGRFFRPFGREGQVAVAMAVQDMVKDEPLRAKGEFERELRRLLA
jgi:hypothetical protein